MNKKSIVLSSGDPAGCGPAICLEAIREYGPRRANFILVGDEKIFSRYSLFKALRKKIDFVDLDSKGIERVRIGVGSKVSGKVSLNYIDKALNIIKTSTIRCLVTAPVSKEAIQSNLPSFLGHTEYLSDYFKSRKILMFMVSKKIKVALLTRHIPLKLVSKKINKKYIASVFSLVHESLRRQFKIASPKIAIASVNPHAGVDTFLGNEEKIMLDVVKLCKDKIYGPYPADTLFTPQKIKEFDSIICAYHDQAMIPFKLLSMREGVNLTLGLPIIRTSPAHGVAYDLLKKRKKPFSSSMLAAIKLAAKISS